MKFLLIILSLAAAISAPGLETAKLLNGHESAGLLEKKCIHTEVSGVLTPQWNNTTFMLSQPDFIQWIQAEYRRSVSKDGTVSFPIVATGNGAYHYINKKKQRTDITELYREQTSDTTFDLIYHAKGKRFFGTYEVLIHVHAINAGDAGTIYTATVHAYPNNGPLRFFARRMSSVERYFERKTKLIAQITGKICSGMEEPVPFILKPNTASL